MEFKLGVDQGAAERHEPSRSRKRGVADDCHARIGFMFRTKIRYESRQHNNNRFYDHKIQPVTIASE